jgi:hypothetical protein
VGGILDKDFPLVQGTVLFVATAYVLINVLVDVAYAYADPRIRWVGVMDASLWRAGCCASRRAGRPGDPAALAPMALAAPWLSPRDPIKTAPRDRAAAAGRRYWLGQRSARAATWPAACMHGARISLTVGSIAVSIAVGLGAPIGLVSGFYGGRLDALIMRVIDVLLAFPGILLALAIVERAHAGLTNVMIAVGLSAVPTYARLVRASVLAPRELYVEAARALGSRDPRSCRATSCPTWSRRSSSPPRSASAPPSSPPPRSASSASAASRRSRSGAACSARAATTCARRGGSRRSPARHHAHRARHELLGDGLRDVLDPRL